MPDTGRTVEFLRGPGVLLSIVAVLAGAAAVGVRRSRTLSDGDCSTGGPWDCGYDGPLAFAVSLGMGVALVLVAATVVWFTRTRRRKAGGIAVGACLVAWAVAVTMLYVGAGEL